jgi:hypothetical protein
MASNLPPSDLRVYPLLPRRSQGAMDALKQPPWSKWGWGLFVPLVFAGNFVVATLAWFIVALIMG